MTGGGRGSEAEGGPEGVASLSVCKRVVTAANDDHNVRWCGYAFDSGPYFCSERSTMGHKTPT